MPTTTRFPRVRLQVDLLGRLDARTTTGRHIRLPGRHAQALFALLVLARRPRSREAIAADLWPDADGGSAGSLRQALWLVRQGLLEAGIPPDHLLDIDADTVGIRMEAHIDLDVTRVRRVLPRRRAVPRRTPSRSIAATCSRASATIASRPSANGWPIGSRTRWRSWRSDDWTTAICGRPRRGRSADRARPPARGGPRRADRGPRPVGTRARRSSASTAACATSSRGTSVSGRSPTPTRSIARRSPGPSSVPWSRPPSSKPTGRRSSWRSPASGRRSPADDAGTIGASASRRRADPRCATPSSSLPSNDDDPSRRLPRHRLGRRRLLRLRRERPTVARRRRQPAAEPASRADPRPAHPGANDLPASITDPVVAEIARVAGVPVDRGDDRLGRVGDLPGRRPRLSRSRAWCTRRRWSTAGRSSRRPAGRPTTTADRARKFRQCSPAPKPRPSAS